MTPEPAHWSEERLREHVAGFLASQIPLEVWAAHHAHLAAATVICRRHPEDATRRMRRGIQRLNAANGLAPDRYHETVTRFYVERILELLADRDSGQSDVELVAIVIEELGGSREQRTELWGRYYRDPASIWSDPRARTEWVPPDRES